MPTLHVCSLSRLPETIAQTGARHLVTLINVGTPVERPAAIDAARHLVVGVSDIVEPLDGHVLPAEDHVGALLDFVNGWDREHPLVIHCYAGISRSTASAFTAICALNPQRDEGAVARQIRALSPSAYPNRLIVTLADKALNRNGRMLRALDDIGPGSMTIEGRPFRLDLE